jgi:hypothetical protein
MLTVGTYLIPLTSVIPSGAPAAQYGGQLGERAGNLESVVV